MISRLFLCLFLSAATLTTGCVFSRKKPKDSNLIAGEVEATFRQRWIDKRTAELVAQGAAGEAARRQASDEFQAKYDFNPSRQK